MWNQHTNMLWNGFQNYLSPVSGQVNRQATSKNGYKFWNATLHIHYTTIYVDLYWKKINFCFLSYYLSASRWVETKWIKQNGTFY